MSEKSLSLLERLLDIVRGKSDIRKQMSLILNPERPITTSNLSELQLDFVENAYWYAISYDELEPLKQDADFLLQASLSKGGFGILQTIEMVQSMTQTRIEHATVQEKGVAQKVKDKVTGSGKDESATE